MRLKKGQKYFVSYWINNEAGNRAGWIALELSESPPRSALVPEVFQAQVAQVLAESITKVSIITWKRI